MSSAFPLSNVIPGAYRLCRFAPVELFFLLVVHLALASTAINNAVAQAAETDPAPHKNVLVLYDEQDKLPGLATLDLSLRTTLASATFSRIDVYSESMDRSRFETDGYQQFFRDYLREKYSRKKIDVIVSVMGPSLDFLLSYGNGISPGTPIVFCGVDGREIESRSLSPNVTGVLLKREFHGTLDVALKLQPDTRKVIFISGSSGFDKRLAADAMKELHPYESRVEIEYLTNFDLNDLLKTVSQLPPNTIVLCSTVFRDGTGTAYVPHDVVSVIAEKANMPVYGFLDQFLGRGIVGGHLYSLDEHGKRAAELALKVLGGQQIAQLPVVEPDISIDSFDWRALQKWGIDESLLPAGSIVQYKVPSAWEQYRVYIASAIAILIFQSILIGLLLLSRARRRKAEAEISEFQSLAAAEHDRLNEIVANTPGVVWETMIDPITHKLRLWFISDHVEKMLGYSSAEIMSTPDFWLSLFFEDDQSAFFEAARETVAGGQAARRQFRCVKKEGAVIWIDAHLAPIFDGSGTIVGVRGVSIDITDEKLAESELRDRERELREAQRVSQIGNWEWDPKTETLTWSEELYRMAGIDPSQSAPTFEEHARLLTPESFARLTTALTAALDEGTPYEVELELVRPDKTHLWASARGEPVRDKYSNIIGLRGTLQNIHSRKKIEEALRESEALFRNMADTTPAFIWIADVNMKCTFFNQGLIEFTGRSMEELCGEGWLRSVHIDDVEHCIATYSAAYETQKEFVLDFRARRADGVYRWFYDLGTPRFSPNGEFLGYIGTCVDISDRKEADAERQKAHEEVLRLQRQLQDENIYLKEVIKLERDFEEIVGHSDSIKYVLFKIEQVAPTDATVLITGETGTGKELVARAVHSASPRSSKPLVTVNCATLSATLIESELFGHERGAFTGAMGRKIGRFELADGATLFLDEVGELPIGLQAKLLRVIEEGEFERLGSSRSIKVDVRLIAATNRDLEAEVKRGTFREDLLFRLNVFPITVPPLRERRDDIPVLIEYFTTRFAKKVGKNIRSITPATIRRLTEHYWPGNIRELANVIERSVINTQTDILQVSDAFAPTTPVYVGAGTLEEIERKHIIETLESTRWRVDGSKGAAVILGLNPSTLRTRMAKLGIAKPRAHSIRAV